jgi:drug/metabolite transporter (DMT)-like permease
MSPDLLRGAAYIVVSELLLVTMSAIIKAVSSELPTEMMVFFRNLFGLLVLMPLVLRNGVGSLRTRVPHLHLTRGLVGVSAMYCFFYTLGELPLAEATIYKLTAPLFIPLIAWLWLRERAPVLALWAVLIGFIGVLLILKPGVAAFSAAALIGLLGAALAATAKVTIRRMSVSEPSTRIVFYFGLVATSASAVPLLWAWQTPTMEALGWLLLMGVCATSAQLLLTRAYSLAPAGQIAPLTYVSVLFGALYGWLFWQEGLGVITVIGMVVTVLAGILTTRARVETPAGIGRASALHSAASDRDSLERP